MSIATESPRRVQGEIGSQSPASIWHKLAPKAVRKAYAQGDEPAGWRAWRRHLRTRKHPAGVGQWFEAGDRTLTWGLAPNATIALPSLRFNRADRRETAHALHQWLDDADGGTFSVDYALSALAWCRSLPRLAAVLSAKSWWKLLDHLLHTVAEANETDVTLESSGSHAIVQQILAGELALTLAILFPEIAVCQNLWQQASQTLSAGLIDLLDGKGLGQAAHFSQMRPLLACWTRCRLLAGRTEQRCWSDKSDAQYRRLVRNTLRLARRDGSQAFSETCAPHDAELLAVAAEFSGSRSNRALAALILRGGKNKNNRKCDADVPAPRLHSEWAATAVLRPDWARSAPRLTVLYPGASCRIELACGKDVLLSGQWSLDVRVDGTPAAPVSDWSELCWISDADADYLELEIELDQGLRVQRQMLLARKDRFLLMADAILGSRRAAIDYRGTLPLCSGTTFRAACETREGAISGRKPRATVLPLALPEWLADRRGGELAKTPGGVELHQTAVAQSLWAPLFFDLDRRRMIKPLTWRQLSVGESMATQPADAAVGYRVAVGRKQWLLYRSLARPQCRSVLGHHLQSETLVARFHRDGQIESLIEIE